MKRLMIYILICLPLFSVGQKQNNNWCFGDSSGINFNGIATSSATIINSRGSCCSISDSSGNLLIYAAYDTTSLLAASLPFKVYNSSHQVIANGDSLIGGGQAYHEITIVPFPGNDSLYYVFIIGVIKNYGLYYSIVNINSDSVIQKNVQLMPNQQADCISAVKHANGRDWWIVGRKLAFSSAQWNKKYYKYLITPDSISGPFFQNIGDTNYSGISKISFSPTGDTLLFTNAGDLIQYFNFDRCTGLLSNPVTIRAAQTTGYFEWTWSNEFSPDGRFIYTSTSKDTTQLFQYDLQSPNPLASRVTLYQSTFPTYCGGDVKRAPDGKIYFSIAYEDQIPAYPYPDSIYNMYNMNLSVINSPDSPGTACNFTPYSFYLGGKRTYWGLPNNPDYFLGPKIGSGCDTLTAINEQSQRVVISNLFPNPNNGNFTVNYFLPNGKSGAMEIYNMQGQKVFEMRLPRFTYMQEVKINKLPSGMYAVRIQGGDKSVTKKFIKE